MARSLAEHLHSVDVRPLVRGPWRSGTLRWLVGDRETGSVGYELHPQDCLVLIWTSRGTAHRLPVALVSTAPHFGGVRWWALCPGCGRRCAVLYGYGRGFACRLCLRLTYESTRENAFSRACRRVAKVRGRYGAPQGIAWPWGSKPRRMRWVTFARILDRERAAQSVMVAHQDAFCASVERLAARPGRPATPRGRPCRATA